MEQKRCISSLTLAELSAELKALGQPGFRAKQIFHWVHQKLVTEFSAMTDQPKTLLAKLEETFYIAAPQIERRQEAKDGTVKYLLRMADGNCIETVVMRYHYGNTVCVSTQVIEAGVDISFQRVIRFSAGMDSVVQAAGRCNRHAEQKEPAPVRLIRCTDERLRGLDDIVRGQTATTALLAAFYQTPEAFRHDLSSEEAIRFYYRRLYAEIKPGNQDDQTQAHGSLYHLLADNPRYADANCAQAERYLLRQAFRLAGGLFQVFDEDTSALLVPYGRGRELQNTLWNAAQVYGQKDWAVIRGCIDEAKG